MGFFSQNLHATHTNLAKSSGGPYVAAELRGGSGDLRRVGMAADGTCWQAAFGTLCSSRDDQAFYPHLRVALATGVCVSQRASAAFEIAVVKCMMLCVRSLIEMLARKHVHIIL